MDDVVRAEANFLGASGGRERRYEDAGVHPNSRNHLGNLLIDLQAY
jgi:hypothetical protein